MWQIPDRLVQTVPPELDRFESIVERLAGEGEKNKEESP